jgi:hypothetical protein
MTFLLGKSTTHRSPQNSASAGSATTPEVKALNSKKQAQPRVFFGYFLLRKKNGGALLRSFENKQPKKVTT